MTDEIKRTIIEKGKDMADKAFKVLNSEPRDILKTGYAYWLYNNNKVTDINPTGGKISPTIGRDTDAGTFEMYKDGAWVEVNKNDYWYDVVDKDGNVETKPNGSPRRKHYFEKMFEWDVVFKEDVELEVWNSEHKKLMVESISEARFRAKSSVNTRMKEYLEDPRNADTFMKITFDKNKPPADMYGVRFDS